MTTELAGLLRERMTLERASATPDGAGGVVAGWVAVATLWAGIASERPGPGVEAERRSGRARFTVTLRDRSDVGLECRLIWRRGVLKILGITRDPAMPDLLDLRVEESER